MKRAIALGMILFACRCLQTYAQGAWHVRRWPTQRSAPAAVRE